MDYESRQQNLRSKLSRHRLDGLLIVHLPNIRYLSGFTGSSAILVVTESKSVFFSDGRYSAQPKPEWQARKSRTARKAPILPAAEGWLRIGPNLGRSRIGVASEENTLSEEHGP